MTTTPDDITPWLRTAIDESLRKGISVEIPVETARILLNERTPPASNWPAAEKKLMEQVATPPADEVDVFAVDAGFIIAAHATGEFVPIEYARNIRAQRDEARKLAAENAVRLFAVRAERMVMQEERDALQQENGRLQTALENVRLDSEEIGDEVDCISALKRIHRAAKEALQPA